RVRAKAGMPEETPQLGEVLDGVRIEAASERLAAPLLVGNRRVFDFAAVHLAEGRDDVPHVGGRTDQSISRARGHRWTRQKADGDTRHILRRNERDDRSVLSERQRNRSIGPKDTTVVPL